MLTFKQWATMAVVGGSLSGAALANNPFFVTFNPSIDGFTLPSQTLNGDYFELPDGSPGGTSIENYTGNTVFIDTNFQAAGNASNFAAGNPALWGNPTDGNAEVYLYFGNRDGGAPQTLSFNFAWASQNQHAQDYLDLYVSDSSLNSAYHTVNLNSFYAGQVFGGFDGYEGFASFSAAGLGLNDIQSVSIDLSPVAQINTGSSGEFAIDNLSIDGGNNGGGGGGGGGGNSDIEPVYMNNDGSYSSGLAGLGSNSLLTGSSNPGSHGLNFAVRNNSGEDTSYSVVLQGDFLDGIGGDQSNVFIQAGQVNDPGANGYLDTSLPSGEYNGTATIVNNQNSSDQDETVDLHYVLYDAPDITDNSGTTLNVGDSLTISNAAAGPHAGARRASLHVTGAMLNGAGFIISGDLLTNDVIYAGDDAVSTVGFNDLGAVAGLHTGSYTLDFRMTDDSPNAQTGYLNGALPVASMTWDLEHTVTAQSSVSAPVSSGQNFGDAMIGVSNGNTGAAIIDGVSTSSQSVAAMFIANPGLSNAATFGDAVEIAFSIAPDLHVLQMAYLDSQLPGGFNEKSLRVLVQDGSVWKESILLNSDNGAGGVFFDGSYAAYLATLSGSAAELSTYGVDIANNRVWAVLDHNSTYIVGVIPEPTSLAMLALLGITLVARRRR